MTKKSKIIGAALVSCLLIGGGGVYYANEQKKAEQERIYVEKINDQVDSISKDLAEFEKESEENKKFEQLKSLISEFEEYKNGDKKDEKIINKYQASIKTARQFFKEENEKQIEDNTPKELEKENISNLKEKTDTLNKLNEKINNQKEIVYSEQEIQELNEKIEKLLKDFSNRIKDLEKKEAEEKAVKEAKEKQEQFDVLISQNDNNQVKKDSIQDTNFSENNNNSYKISSSEIHPSSTQKTENDINKSSSNGNSHISSWTYEDGSSYDIKKNQNGGVTIYGTPNGVGGYVPD